MGSVSILFTNQAVERVGKNVFYQNSRLLHNETINIWSHLLGFLILAGIFFRDLIFVLPSTESGIEVTHTDFFILFALILCYQVSLFDLLKIILETVTKTLRSLGQVGQP